MIRGQGDTTFRTFQLPELIADTLTAGHGGAEGIPRKAKGMAMIRYHSAHKSSESPLPCGLSDEHHAGTLLRKSPPIDYRLGIATGTLLPAIPDDVILSCLLNRCPRSTNKFTINSFTKLLSNSHQVEGIAVDYSYKLRRQ